MNTFSRVGLTLVTGASLALVAAPASAHPVDDSDHHGGVAEVGEWMPVPEEYYSSLDLTFPACGDSITIEYGDVRAVEQRVSMLKNGATLSEIRGQATVDLTRQSDGAMIDELDISGVGSTTISADGTMVTDKLFGASILFPFTEAETPVFQEAFGTDLAYFSDPAESVVIEVTVDPETSTVTEVRSIEVEAHIVDLCEKFDGADKKRHHGDKHHDHHHGHGHHHDHGHGH
jgi:hypothetical protein